MPIIDINDVARNAGLLCNDEHDVNHMAKDVRDKSKNSEHIFGFTYDVNITKLSKALGERIVEKKSLIVGHLAPYVIDRDQTGIVIILRRDPRDLYAVYGNRHYSEQKASQNIQSEVLGVIAHDTISKFREKAFQLNNLTGRINDVVEKAVSIISTGTGGDNTIDWLEDTYKNGNLGKVFGSQTSG